MFVLGQLEHKSAYENGRIAIPQLCIADMKGRAIICDS